MLDTVKIKEQLINWMQTFVEKPHPALGGWAPCPFARQARINNSIEIRFSEPSLLAYDVYKSLKTLDQGREVVVLCWDHNLIGVEFVQELVLALNRELMPKNYVILEDHPNSPEWVNGVCMNFGTCGLFVIQKLDKLNTAADQLRSKGYYDHWDQAAMDGVVTWRNA
jgi:hypothetical protein